MRRGDALRHGINGGKGYHGFNLGQLMLATSPPIIEKALTLWTWSNLPVALFTNDDNSSIYQSLIEKFQIVTERELIRELPLILRDRYVCSDIVPTLCFKTFQFVTRQRYCTIKHALYIV